MYILCIVCKNPKFRNSIFNETQTPKMPTNKIMMMMITTMTPIDDDDDDDNDDDPDDAD